MCTYLDQPYNLTVEFNPEENDQPFDIAIPYCNDDIENTDNDTDDGGIIDENESDDEDLGNVVDSEENNNNEHIDTSDLNNF